MNGLAKYQTQLTNFSGTSASWQLPPESLKLEDNQVHIWLARLDQEDVTEFEPIISADEWARASRFRFERDRKRFIKGRGLLRKLLGQYSNTNPCQLHFAYNLDGKPGLGGQWPSSLKFNLSHSDDLALYAITSDREIGIDLERIKPSVIDEGMISLCLTQLERAHFQLLPEDERNSFFFDCWTRKEAFLKAGGSGLALSPNKIETSSFAKYATSLIINSAEPREIQISFQKLPPIDGYATALAVEGSHPQLKFWLQPHLSREGQVMRDQGRDKNSLNTGLYPLVLTQV